MTVEGPGLETYFFSHSQTFASGFNLNSQIAVCNSQLVFPTFEQFLTLRCGMAIVSWGWNLVHRSPLRWQRTCWRPHSSFLRLKKYIIFSATVVTWQDSESVLRGASTFPLPLLQTCWNIFETKIGIWYEMKYRTRNFFRVPLFSTRKTEFQLAFCEFASMNFEPWGRTRCLSLTSMQQIVDFGKSLSR